MKLKVVLCFSTFLISDGLACQQTYSLVQPLSPYTTKSFFISQYEMRQGTNNLPMSTNVGEPWHLPRNAAQTACQSIGLRLPTNAEWQTIARQAEYVQSNWTGPGIGGGFLIADPTYLPNGAVLFNFGNGVWEQVSGDLSGETGNSGPIYLVNGTTNPNTISVAGVSGGVKYHFGPQDGYIFYPYDPGLGVLTHRYSQSIMRGGDDSEPGFFGTALNHGPNDQSTDIGFRCAYTIQ